MEKYKKSIIANEKLYNWTLKMLIKLEKVLLDIIYIKFIYLIFLEILNNFLLNNI